VSNELQSRNAAPPASPAEHDQAVREAADARMAEFIERMHAAGDPGAGLCSVGGRRVRGWWLEFDPATGGGGTRVVIGMTGCIHRTQARRWRRAGAPSAGEWLIAPRSRIEPTYRLLALGQRLDHVLQANHVS
jgi:hypothetical protein